MKNELGNLTFRLRAIKAGILMNGEIPFEDLISLLYEVSQCSYEERLNAEEAFKEVFIANFSKIEFASSLVFEMFKEALQSVIWEGPKLTEREVDLVKRLGKHLLRSDSSDLTSQKEGVTSFLDGINCIFKSRMSVGKEEFCLLQEAAKAYGYGSDIGKVPPELRKAAEVYLASNSKKFEAYAKVFLEELVA